MGDADELLFLTEGDDAMPVRKPDRARGLEARRGEAHEFIEEDAVVGLASAFRHELEVTPRPPLLRYHDTAHERQSTEAPRGWGGLRTFAATDSTSRIDVKRTVGIKKGGRRTMAPSFIDPNREHHAFTLPSNAPMMSE